jgi:RNA polymerase sigma-70 factor (ECF subfamily)
MDHFGGDVWNFAYFLTRRPEAADDLSQEVFLSAYNSLYAYRGEGSVKGWLLIITRNKALHYLQSAFIRKVTLTDLFTDSGRAPAAEQVYFDRLESRRLWEAVMTLPRKYREILILDYHYGLARKEIAALTGIPEGTVKSRAYRARRKLARLLSGGEGE